MNTELAQIVSLVAYGNRYLYGESEEAPQNSTFNFVSGVKFARYKNARETNGVEVAGSVAEWFAWLREQKATRLWNIAFSWDRQDMPEYRMAGFAGGIPRAIQADMPDSFELWYPRWQTGALDKAKPWLVEYRALTFNNSYLLPVGGMKPVKKHLEKALSAAEKFSRRPQVKLEFWADRFKAALELLRSSTPVVQSFPDLLPPAGFSLEARQVLAASAQAYVFGGMGSWNDLGFEQPDLQKEYSEITGELYTAIKFGIVQASNSFQPEK